VGVGVEQVVLPQAHLLNPLLHLAQGVEQQVRARLPQANLAQVGLEQVRARLPQANLAQLGVEQLHVVDHVLSLYDQLTWGRTLGQVQVAHGRQVKVKVLLWGKLGV